MLCLTSVPSVYSVSKEQKELDAYIKSKIDFTASKSAFVVDPYKYLRWLIEHTGLTEHDVRPAQAEHRGRCILEYMTVV